MTLLLTIILIIVAIAIIAAVAENNANQQKKKDNEQIISIEIGRVEKYIPDGHVGPELLQLLSDAKEKGENTIMYPKGKYDELVSISLKSYFDKKDGNSPGLVKCPKCKSTQITAEKTGYSLGKGLAGAFLTGGIGLIAGFHGANNLQVYCIKCGHKWKAGKQ